MRQGRIACLLGPVLLAALSQPACGKSDAYIKEADTSNPDAGASAPGPLGDKLAVDEAVSLAGLAGPADVVRDSYGIAHIYATSPQDALRVEGYVMARDRGLQMELLRRMATGRMAEILASSDPAYIDNDILMRSIGLHRAARAQYDAMDGSGEARSLLEAFADGVSQFNAALQSGKVAMPLVWQGASAEWFTPWTPQDSLAVLKLHNFAAAVRIDEDIDLTMLMQSLRETWKADAAEAAVARRAHVAPDLLRFAPASPVSVFDALPKPGAGSPAEGAPRSGGPVNMELLTRLAPTMAALRTALEPVGHGPARGANAFAVAAERSASGAAMLAVDPHRPLAMPSALWFAHLNVSGKAALHAAGAALPGVPGMLFGFNEKAAWAASESMNDEADAYAEVLSEDAAAVRLNGKDVPLEHQAETIVVQGGKDIELDVLIARHHGPLLPIIGEHSAAAPDPAVGALSVRWPGLETGGEFEAMVGLLRAADVDAAQAALATWNSGADHFVLADAQGAVAAVSQAVPMRPRRAYFWDASHVAGTLPCSVLSGSGDAEWAGRIEQASMPAQLRPERGWVLAANADPSGVTFDNDPSNDRLSDGSPVYLGCVYDPGLRQARIAERLGALLSVRPEQLASIQSDVKSALGTRLSSHLRSAIAHAVTEQASPGKFPGLTALVSSQRFSEANVSDVASMLSAWEQLHFEAGAGVKLSDGVPSESSGEDARASKGTLVFNAWLVRMLQVTLGDEASRMGFEQGLPGDMGMRALLHLIESDPKGLASFDKELGDSILFDDMTTDATEGRDERVIVALLDAVEWLNAGIGQTRDDWRWGLVHAVRMAPVVAGLGFEPVPAEGDKSFPQGFPRHGDLFSVDASSYEFSLAMKDLSFRNSAGPSMRLVVEMNGQGPRASVSIAGEQTLGVSSGVSGEEIEYWRTNLRHEVPFATDAVTGASKYHIRVSPK